MWKLAFGWLTFSDQRPFTMRIPHAFLEISLLNILKNFKKNWSTTVYFTNVLKNGSKTVLELQTFIFTNYAYRLLSKN